MPFRRSRAPESTLLPLSSEQQAVLDGIDAGLSSNDDLTDRTGLDSDRLQAVTRELVSLGIVVAEPVAEEVEAANDELPPGVEPWSGDPMPEAVALPPDPRDEPPASEDRSPEPAWRSSQPPRRSSAPPRSRPPVLDELNYRRVYEERFRALEPSQRADAARHVHGSDLFALCLDASPEVIGAVLENSHFGLDHARSIALHHKNPQGLEVLTRRHEIVRDQHVQRRLLQNAQLPETVLERVLRGKQLLDTYRLSIDRELPERNRLRVRSRLLRAFNQAEPDERAALVIRTEGRCLVSLTGATFDGRTSQVLCNHSYTSSLFVQNLARFAATPPMLLAKLLRSTPARNQPQLRAMLLRHPNMSAELKRRG